MPTYVYEIIDGEDAGLRFEVRQSIHDSPLTHHPETGGRVRRIISGGVGFLKLKASRPQAGRSSGCCPGCHD